MSFRFLIAFCVVRGADAACVSQVCARDLVWEGASSGEERGRGTEADGIAEQMVLELGDASTVKNDANKLSCDLEFKVKVRLLVRLSWRAVLTWVRYAGLLLWNLYVRKLGSAKENEELISRRRQRHRRPNQRTQGHGRRRFWQVERCDGDHSEEREFLLEQLQMGTQLTKSWDAGEGQGGPLRCSLRRHYAKVRCGRGAPVAQRVAEVRRLSFTRGTGADEGFRAGFGARSLLRSRQRISTLRPKPRPRSRMLSEMLRGNGRSWASTGGLDTLR